MYLVKHLSWLTQNFPKAFNTLVELLETHIDDTSIVVVSHDIQWISPTHHRCDRLANIGQCMLQIVGLEAKDGKVG